MAKKNAINNNQKHLVNQNHLTLLLPPTKKEHFKSRINAKLLRKNSEQIKVHKSHNDVQLSAQKTTSIGPKATKKRGIQQILSKAYSVTIKNHN